MKESVFKLLGHSELGLVSCRKKAVVCQRNTSFLKRFEKVATLEKHSGCVNTIHWNSTGSLLVSGSDDLNICVWSYPQEKLVDSWESNHTSNVFNARFMPQTNDSLIITCARDSDIRTHKGLPTGFVPDKLYSCHDNSTKKFGVFDNDPNTFISCSEDGTVRFIDLREFHSCPSNGSCQSNVIVKVDHDINSISINPQMENVFAIGCGNKFVRLYDLRMPLTQRVDFSKCLAKFQPSEITSGHVTGVKFSNSGKELLASYSSDAIYMYDTNSFLYHIYPVPPPGIPDTSNPVENIMLQTENAHAHFHRKEYTLAIMSYTIALEQCKNNDGLNRYISMLYSNRAAALIRENERFCHRKALKDCYIGECYDSKNAICVFRRACILASQKEYVKSIRHIDRALSICSEVKNEQLAKEIKQFKSNLNNHIENTLPEFSDDDDDDDDDEENKSEIKKKKEKCSCGKICLGGCTCESKWHTLLDVEIEPAKLLGEREQESRVPIQTVPVYHDAIRNFSGHSNFTTVKDVNFYGPNSEFIMSGSDDGNVIWWEKSSGKIMQILKGDEDVVNCIQGNPNSPAVVCSGIDHTIKLFEPKAEKENPLNDLVTITERNAARQREPSWFQAQAVMNLMQEQQGCEFQ